MLTCPARAPQTGAMTEGEKPDRPRLSTAGEARKRDRDARLARALRDNLRKRKDQARAQTRTNATKSPPSKG